MTRMTFCRWLPWTAAVLAVLLLLTFTGDEITRSGNETSRLALVDSLGNHGAFEIDGSIFHTVDKGRIDGRFYSDKPMLYSLYLTAVYLVGNVIGIDFTATYHEAVFLLNFCGSGIFVLMIMALLYCYLRNDRQVGAVIMSFLGIFSTWLFSYGGIVNNHVPAAFFLLLLYWLLDQKSAKDRGGEWRSGMAGLCAGIILNLEIPTGFFFALAGGVFLLFRYRGAARVKHAVFFVGFFLSPLLLIAWINWLAYGSPLPVYMVGGAYDFPENIHSRGMAGLESASSRQMYFYHMLIGARGLFSYMPALVLVIPAWIFRRKILMRGPAPFFAAAAVTSIGFYGFATGDYGGWAYGFRFLIPMIPLLWLWLSQWLLTSAGRWWRSCFVALVMVGILTSAVGAYNPWPVCSRDNRQLINTAKMNFYCAAYEHGQDTVWFRLAQHLIGNTDLRRYLPLAFYNTRQLDESQLKTWPVRISYRVTVGEELRAGWIEVRRWGGSALAGILFVWLLTVTALRLLGWLMGQRRLWLGPANFLLNVTPLVVLQVGVIVLLCGLTVGLTWIAFIAAAGLWALLLWRMLPQYRLIARPLRWQQWRGPGMMMAIPAMAAVLCLAASLSAPPWSWDVLTYHLFIPLRWIQEQHFITVPTVFGDNAAAYAPKNWFLLASAGLQLLPGDVVMEALTLPLLLFAAAAVARLTDECGGGVRAGRWAGVMVFFTPIAFEYSLYAQPDVINAGLLVAALYWLLRQRRETDDFRSAWLVALCCGLAAGMKTAALPFVVMPMLWGGLVECRRGRWLNSGLIMAIFLLSGGGWYLLNWYLYGNPLFPLALRLDGWRIFAGAYEASAVRQGEFTAPSLWRLTATVWQVFGPVTALLVPIGLCGWLAACFSKQRDNCRLVAIHLVVWLLVYVFVIPHNLQTRFLFPVLFPAIGGVVLLALRLKIRLLIYLAAAGLGMTVIWFCRQRLLLLTGGGRIFILELSLLTSFVLAAAWMTWQHQGRKRLLYSMFFASLLAVVLSMATGDGRKLRAGFYRRLLGTEVVFAFNRALPEGQGMTIAYTGFNRPYVLVGPDLLNRVIYVNVQGEAADDFFRFWSVNPIVYSYHKPALYRDRPNYVDWVRNLKTFGVDYLVILPLAAAERRYLSATPEGLPMPEAQWVTEHPELFTIAARGRHGVVYRFSADGLSSPAP